VGGLRKLQIVDVQDVTFIPDAVNSVVPSAVSLTSGVTIASISFPTQGGDFAETPKDSDMGTTYTSKLRVDLPKDAVELGQWVNKYKDREVIAFYQDENGRGVIVGDLERPLLIKVSRTSGRRPADKNFYEMTLEGVSDHTAYYYTPIDKDTPKSQRVYSAGYTFGYLRNL
jgi:hypothetical protein